MSTSSAPAASPSAPPPNPSAPSLTSSTPLDADDAPRQIRLTIAPRYYLTPGTAVIVGTTLGLLRGGRAARLRFLAENAHRPPTTVRGWYFYNKTRNYRVMSAGLRTAALDAGRLAASALGWVAIEDGMREVGLGDVREVGAGVGTAGLFALVYRLPVKVATRTVALGLVVGSAMSALRYSQGFLKEKRDEIARRAAEEAKPTSDEEKPSVSVP